MATPASAQPTSGAEEYLQAIWTLLDEGGPVTNAQLAAFLRVSPASVSEMVHRLEREGLVDLSERREIRLTERGDGLARRVVRRHRLIERMLVDLLGYEWWKTHDEAERLEHAISPEMEEKLAERLGDPDSCPHGNPMPGTTRRRWSQPLENAPPGDPMVIERIPDQFEHEPGFLEYLDQQGLRPGTTLRLVDRSADAVVLEIDGTRRSVRPDCGLKVWVRPAS
ncbi:MAG: metal-dependent transcriptional regulator [Chloroflexi bacterium]|nr:metal-dependent transcriptional regulator [Chloroflexota bacterium]